MKAALSVTGSRGTGMSNSLNRPERHGLWIKQNPMNSRRGTFDK
jgi:hypothetical protein